MLKKIIFSIFLLATAIACQQSETEGSADSHFLLKKETLGIYNNENNLFIYDKDIHQYAFNTKRRTFRIQNSAQDRFMSCTLAGEPVAGKSISMHVETKGISSFPTQDIEVQVLKNTSGKIWLWNDQKKIGFVIRLE